MKPEMNISEIPSKIYIRKVTPTDIPEITSIAANGFATSPVFKFVRTKAHQYPEDVLQSYERQNTISLLDPDILFECVVMENVAIDSAAVDPDLETKASVFQDVKTGGEVAANSRIVGFAVWRLSPRSARINRSFSKQLKFTYCTVVDRLTSIFHRNRDTDKRRSAKVGQICRKAQILANLKSGMELERMVIDPEFQQQGFGTLLGQSGLRIAEEEKCPVLVIATPMGERLYEKLGFQKVGVVEARDGDASCELAVQVWDPQYARYAKTYIES